MALTKIQSGSFEAGAITTEDLSANTTAAFAVSLSPKITTVNVANSTYSILDDTAVNVGGGYIVVTGSAFQSGAQVLIDNTPATSTTYVNSTTLRAQVPAANAATYNLYVSNPDGGVGLKLNGITYSGTPTWVTSSTLANVTSDQAFTGTFSATGATSYNVSTGSSLPTGFTLVTANGYYYGIISVGSSTTYSFTIDAIDNELQESPRTFSLTAAPVTIPETVEYLVVAGGGAGALDNSGGGGAGGYRTGNLSISSATTYTVTVGSGGTTASAPSNGGSGSSSVFHNITSAGGGGGGGRTKPGVSGGSGGGAARDGSSGGSGNTPSVSPSQGNNGGSAGNGIRSAGGGGAGAVGQDAGPSAAGSGGDGRLAFDGNYYAGGGGGGNNNEGGPYGAGGLGGGGYGRGQSAVPNPQVSGVTNSGGGGGGGDSIGGNGGSGIVIIRYPDIYEDASATTGSPTYTNTGGYKTYKFTGSGSITW